MNRFSLCEFPQFIDKNSEEISQQKEVFFKEIKDTFYYLLEVSDSVEMVIQSQGQLPTKEIKVLYFIGDRKLDIDPLKESLKFLKLNQLSQPIDLDHSSIINQQSITRKINFANVGEIFHAPDEDELNIMPLRRGFNPEQNGIIPIIQPINSITDNYKWKYLLNVLAKTEGTVTIKVEKFKLTNFDRAYATQCLQYYQYTYENNLTSDEYLANTSIYQKIIARQDIIKANIFFSGDKAESLKMAFARDLGVENFDFSAPMNISSLTYIDREEKEFISNLPYLWSKDNLKLLLTPPYTFGDALPGVKHYVVKPFTFPYLDKSIQDTNNLLVGKLADESPINLGQELLTKHIFTTGSSGSGKTNTIHHLLYQLQNKIPFLIIDPAKREYEKLMQNAGKEKNIINFLNGNIPSFNPFIPANNITVYSHSAVMAKVLALLCPTNDVAYNLMLNMVRVTYRYKLKPVLSDDKFYLDRFLEIDGKFLRNNPSCIPSLDNFLQIGMQWLKKNVGANNRWGQETIEYFERRWEYLKTSIFKKICSGEPTIPVDRYFKADYLIELYAILDSDESNAIFALMVSLLYEYRTSEGIQDNLQHLTVLEEAHRIIPAQQQGLGENRVTSAASEAAKLLTQMLAEIRAYGEGIIIVDQSPSKIISDVLINSGTKIIHRCGYGGDKDCLAAALSLTEREKNYLSFLPTGDAIAFLADTYQPIYLTVPVVIWK